MSGILYKLCCKLCGEVSLCLLRKCNSISIVSILRLGSFSFQFFQFFSFSAFQFFSF